MKKTMSAAMMLGMAMFATTACDVPEESEADIAEELGEAEAALCGALSSLPAYDSTSVWETDETWTSPYIGGYGTGNCDHWVKDLTSVDLVDTHYRYVGVGPWATISTESECEQLQLRRQHWYQGDIAWWVAGSFEVSNGEWVVPGFGPAYCDFDIPLITGPTNMTRLRVAAQLRNTVTGVNKHVSVYSGTFPN